MKKLAKKAKAGQSAKDLCEMHCPAALVKKPARKAKGGRSANDALKASARQRRLEKQSTKPESPPWDKYNRKGREVRPGTPTPAIAEG